MPDSEPLEPTASRASQTASPPSPAAAATLGEGSQKTSLDGSFEFEIDVEADPTTGYAAIQNAIPVLRSLRITNTGTEPLEHLQVLIACDPPFAQGKHLRLERLEPGESRRIAPIDLAPEHAYLADLTETQTAAIRVTVLASDRELARLNRPIEVLAYNQWAGTRALPELLAAFCMPNDPAVDGLIAAASALLRQADSSLQMNGYQSKDRSVVWKEVSAVYSAVCAAGLHYAEPRASFGTDGQKIRTPDRIMADKVATCLDLAMLFASCLEQAGLNAVVLFKSGHAWVGVWLHPTCFPDPLTDDIQAVRKRVHGGEFLVFETTGAAAHPSHRPSLRLAMEQGNRYLDEDGTFAYAVDIKRAREVRIRPLPARIGPAAQSTGGGLVHVPAGVEPMPPMPALDPAVLKPEELATADTPEGRLAKWKSRLLDLTLRNKLLNFKPTRQSLQLIAPDLPRLEDAVAGGGDFRIRAARTLMEGADPRDGGVHTGRTGNAALDEMALEALDKGELLARIPAEKLDETLLTIDSTARTGLEEGGANTLYLAIGMLHWTEADKAEGLHAAPILLVPVTLRRESVRTGYRLRRHDDEALINPSLLQYLKTKFDFDVTGLDVLHADEKGLDVAKIVQAWRLAVREVARWEVVEQVHLGIFSFAKYLMWKDLQSRTEALKANRVVRHLIDNPGEAFPGDGSARNLDRLDESHRPQDILAPLLLDSSQLKAICAVDDERDLVLEGPPGTGKSQTITNLIVHTIAQGKTVLFVAEKMAALDVVHTRLAKLGLGPFCLELHSAKSSKAAVLQQMGSALEVAGQKTSEDWQREAERLAALRSDLNGLVDALHRPHPNGLTVFEAMGTCIENTGRTPSPMPWADPLTHDRDALDGLRETARRMAALAGQLSTLAGHPLAAIGASTWTPSWEDALTAAIGELDSAATSFEAALTGVGALLGVPVAGLSLDAYGEIDQLLDLLLAAPKVPAGLAGAAHDPSARARVQSLARHGTLRAQAWTRLSGSWKPELATLSALELHARWTDAQSAWWPKKIFAKSSFRKRLTSYRRDAQPPSEGDVDALLEPLSAVNAEDAILAPLTADAEALLQGAWVGTDTDWAAVAAHERWAQQFADALVTFSGTDAAVAAGLRDRLRPMVAENRAALAPQAAAGATIIQYRDALRLLRAALAELERLASPLVPLTGPSRADGALARARSLVAGWLSARRQLQPWCLWRSVRDVAVAQGLQGLVAGLESGSVPLSDVESRFEFAYRSWWLKKTIDDDPVLRSFSSADHERKIREFREADKRFQALTEEYVAATLSGRIPAGSASVAGADSEMGKLRRELSKQRRHMPVRQLVQALPTLLPRLKPCMLMSPLSVAQYLEPGHAQFDLVVFDEASQIPTWDAVGAIARGRQLVVVGDPKQLPPTNFFSKSIGADEDDHADEEVEELESILNECLGSGMNRLSLEWHYRSRHESLITFSNVHYYDSRLVTFPSPVTDDVAVRFEKVAGVYDRGGSRTNRMEADAIVTAIESHYLTDSTRRSVGVVTFNQPQQALIEKLLEARRRTNPALDAAIASQTREPLFIKNLENVQGDERDLIFFSICYGPDAAGKMSMNFGPINNEGGERRLNVAISRAREGVRIFSTLMPEMIDLARVRAAGVRDLKHYLEFALRGPRAIVEQALPTGREPDSPFEREVIRHLRDGGWVVHPQVGCSGYRIDIGVVDPAAPGRYLVGIECDGATYHSGATARDRDRLRQSVLEGLGWRMHRIWSTDWWRDPEREVEKIEAMLGQVLAEAQAAAEEGGSGDQKGAVTSGEAVDHGASPTITRFAAAVIEPVTARPPSMPMPPALPAYLPFDLKVVASGDFYDAENDRLIAGQLRKVIDGEGPIREAELFRKVARAWRLERTGARIVERLRRLVPSDLARTREGELTFYWPSGTEPANWDVIRVARDSDESSRRQVYEVSLEEISAIALHVLDGSGSTPEPDLARTVCRLIGMARTPADAESRVADALRRLEAAGKVVNVQGAWRQVS